MERIIFKYCCYCGKLIVKTNIYNRLTSINNDEFTIEHLVPKSKGGNNSLKNKRPCCKRCNSWRGNKELLEFKNDVKFHLDNKTIREGYTIYDYEIMIENIQFIDDYVKSDIKKFKKLP